MAGQELIYRGRFGAAQLYFSRLSAEHPRETAGPTLEASALIWWGEARDEETYQAVTVDSLLTEAVRRGQAAVDSAADDAARAEALLWLGTAHGYRARQAELLGNLWRAAREARTMRDLLARALELDSACVDCVLGLGAYEYSLARAGAVARLVARIVGLGGGSDAQRGLERMRLASESGRYFRSEARWVYANSLLREGSRDQALREEGLRIIGALAQQFPENPVFRRAAGTGVPTP